ncbi:MAG: type II secretion system major pseudopilin GspG [Planctomycetota bacterium]
MVRQGWIATRRNRGFTLVEIMVVVVVLAVLAALVVPRFGNVTFDAKVSTARACIQSYVNALERYKLTVDSYPTTEQGLEALVKRPTDVQGWSGPYLKEVTKDPWGGEYQYRAPGVQDPEAYDLWSRGGDKADGGTEKGADITSWTEKTSN